MPTIVTKTIKPAGGGDYTTLAAANAARARALVDTVERWECYAGDAGGFAASASWTMDATSALEVVAAAADAHTGIWDDSRATAGTQITGTAAARIRIYRMQLWGLQFAAYGAAAGMLKLYSCIGGITSNNSGYAFAVGCDMYNCIMWKNTLSLGVGAYMPSTLSYSVEWLNCTAVNFSIGFSRESGTATVKNCLAQSCTDGFSGTFNAASDYNISDIASDAPGVHSKTGTVAFVNAAARDYHLAAGDTVARGAGTNLTASGITTDIDWQTRPSSGAWDVGADQIIVSGGITMRQVALQNVALSQPQLSAISA